MPESYPSFLILAIVSTLVQILNSYPRGLVSIVLLPELKLAYTATKTHVPVPIDLLEQTIIHSIKRYLYWGLSGRVNTRLDYLIVTFGYYVTEVGIIQTIDD